MKHDFAGLRCVQELGGQDTVQRLDVFLKDDRQTITDTRNFSLLNQMPPPLQEYVTLPTLNS